jgi:hypothetical protein
MFGNLVFVQTEEEEECVYVSRIIDGEQLTLQTFAIIFVIKLLLTDFWWLGSLRVF